MGLAWSFREADKGKCPNNPYIDCGGASPRSPEHKCNNCGWNPVVANKRVKKWKLAHTGRDFSGLVARIRRRNRR